MEDKTMKSILKYLSIVVLISTSCTTYYMSSGYKDDIYYSPKDDIKSVKQTMVQNNTLTQDTTSKIKDVKNNTDNSNQNEVNQNNLKYSTTETYNDEKGNTYITNNYYGETNNFEYDNYYDYEYATRIRRFYSPYIGVTYYDPWYSDLYWYTYDPFYWGVSVYVGYRWWYPRYYYPYVTYYYPSYYHYYGWGSYSRGYWNGYNHGYYDGYYNGLNDRYIYNPYYYEYSGVSYNYGHRNTFVTNGINNNYSRTSTITKTNETGISPVNNSSLKPINNTSTGTINRTSINKDNPSSTSQGFNGIDKPSTINTEIRNNTNIINKPQETINRGNQESQILNQNEVAPIGKTSGRESQVSPAYIDNNINKAPEQNTVPSQLNNTITRPTPASNLDKPQPVSPVRSTTSTTNDRPVRYENNSMSGNSDQAPIQQQNGSQTLPQNSVPNYAKPRMPNNEYNTPRSIQQETPSRNYTPSYNKPSNTTRPSYNQSTPPQVAPRNIDIPGNNSINETPKRYTPSSVEHPSTIPRSTPTPTQNYNRSTPSYHNNISPIQRSSGGGGNHIDLPSSGGRRR